MNNFAKYTTISFQMVVVILGGALAGRWLDGVLELQFPVFTLILIILAVVLAIYSAIKDFL